MKTIKLPEDLHRLLKVRAAELDKNLQDLTEEAIRKGLPLVTTDAKKEQPKKRKARAAKG